jgi:3-oxoacyl-[acyl-carrier protein] reductase
VDLQLKGKTALITGASQGIGKATALTFAEEGCDVAICARDEGALVVAREEIAAYGIRVAAISADVCQAADAERVVESCVRELGGLDILVNNVGGGTGASRLLETTDDDWRRTYELNLVQTTRMMRLAVSRMQAKGGAIVNIASIAAVVPHPDGLVAYGASKAGVVNATRTLAKSLAPAGVRVNVVLPGGMETPGVMGTARRAGADIPLGRRAHPGEVALAVLFLASDLSCYVTGTELVVDGGATLT